MEIDSNLRNRIYRKEILEISQKLSALHIGPAFSCLEIVDTVYNLIFKRDMSRIFDFILSKGHGAMALYVVLKDIGVITSQEFQDICQKGSKLGGHPDRGNPGVFTSTGSLGHGLPLATGMALARRDKNNAREIFVLMSDGEMMEGSNWEAILLIPTLKLSNICILIDHNKSISRGKIKELHPNLMPISNKLEAFNWAVTEVDGHDTDEIYKSYLELQNINKPKAIICNTIKGKGVSFMENQPIWAYRSPSPTEFRIAINELDA
jgi:transketolase